jgi:glycosyltransferase involved in cell wall biosynthesis
VCAKKGVRELIQAMPQIVQRAPNAHIWIVGRDTTDDSKGRSYSEWVSELIPKQIRRRVTFKGPMRHSELPDIFAKAEVCVFPSYMEAMPNAWLEALAMGKAIVASNTGPGEEIVEDGVSGLLCDPYDPKSIGEKVIELLRNPERRCNLGRHARMRVMNRFSIDVLAAHNELFYKQCLRMKYAN